MLDVKHAARCAVGCADAPNAIRVAVHFVTSRRNSPRLQREGAHRPRDTAVTSLETRGLTIRFGGHVAVDSVSCAFRPGELTAIVGPNGAGKTTYFNLISGQLAASAGEVLLDGRDITRLVRAGAHARRPRPRVPAHQPVSAPERRGERPARDPVGRRRALRHAAALDAAHRPDRTGRRGAASASRSHNRRDSAAAALSHGDQRKLEVALMIALEPKIFMFDEPTAGMSVDEVPVVLDLIAQLKQDTAKIILLVEHKMDVVRSLADRIIVLHNGKLVADGKPADVMASPVVQEAYLGSFGQGSRRMSALLTLSGVETHIGRYHILHGVDLGVPEGRTTMLLGRNGAGKTTTLRTIMGLWRASAGEIRLGGARIEALGTPDIARAGIGYVPETMAVFSDLTVQENLVLAAREGAMDQARLDWIFGFFPPLKKFWLSRAGTLSGGQKQMLSFARAFIEPRRLLLIDEPTKGLAPAIIGALVECLAEVKRRGATILLVEQNFRVAQEIGDTVGVMDNGRVVHTGTMAELARDEALQHRLLGLSLDTHQ